MKRLIGVAVAMLTAGGLASSVATAGAVTMAPVPDESYAEVTVENLISPYGKQATCQLQKGSLGYVPETCKQQRPDGIWVQLDSIGTPFFFYMAYPVWDDPDPIFQALPIGVQKEIEKWELIRRVGLQPGSSLFSSPRFVELALTPADQFPEAMYEHIDEFTSRRGQY
ncbi:MULTISPECIES: hypothetical protein [unclassified Corynebacterium]|uniref:hypothetical protein n=1 Tax=unclassified Corynebacterium TaxID=2624378 RepID=UPI0029CA1BFD|nr:MULTISPECIES: hypothetical protein [unclassified Corynebacterium]WPF66265.1 hypothetical protein OLX12_00600 [Corynebacterium sp. 22KM0430]WPF68755.1 hypothetical protein OLW90_00600 [Corynebacterium sp. 21KM1197]